MKTLTRRHFLKGGAAALGLGMTAPLWRQLAHAQAPGEGKNLVVVFAGGGWDTTACFDPKPGLSTIDSPPGDIRLFGDLPILTGPGRPAVERFFQSYGDLSAVINGIEVRSIAHEECTKRIMTGTNSDSSPDFGAIVGVERGSDLAVPYMILGNTAYTGPHAGSTGRAGITGQVVTLLDPRGAYPIPPSQRRARFSPDRTEQGLIRDYVKARAEADRAKRAQTGLNRDRMGDLTRSLDRSDQLKSLFDSFGERAFQLEYQPQIDLAVRMLTGGMSQAVLIEHPGEWDTHNDNHARQLGLFEDLFAGLHTLADRLDRAGLLEDTAVVVLSEMSRTPKLNDNAGKDHWPVTSALVFGGGVRGSRAYGGTNERFEAAPVDMGSGQMSDGGANITSAAFVSGLLGLMGVDASSYFPDTAPLQGFIAT